MTPEEKVNNEIWWVLQKIRTEELREEKGKPVEIVFESRPIIGAGIPPIEVRRKALLKVQELGGIKVIDDKAYNDTYGVDFVYIIEIIQPKFDEIYKEYQELAAEKPISQEKIVPVSKSDSKPYTLVESGKGYFKFYKNGEKIFIGRKGSRHFRLLQCLCEPHFGVQKTVEAIFEAIRLPKDKNNNRLADYNPQRRTEILKLIEYAKKELQKVKQLQKKIKYCSDTSKNTMWLELE